MPPHMATVEDIYRKHRPRAFTAERRPSSFEVWMWFFMRISGVALLFLVLIHLYIMHLTANGVHQVTWAFVAARWENMGWKAFDWSMLFLALLHGISGLRVIIDDYIHRPGLRTAVKTTLYTVGVILMVIGTAVIIDFDPSH